MSAELVCIDCGHSRSDHDASADGCVYAWGDWQALTDEERSADPCECVAFRESGGSMSTPTTPAGKALHDACRYPFSAPTRPMVQDAILAIEAEARAEGAATERARIADILAVASHQTGEVAECDDSLEPWCDACHAEVDDMLRTDSTGHIVKEAREYRAAIEGEPHA